MSRSGLIFRNPVLTAPFWLAAALHVCLAGSAQAQEVVTTPDVYVTAGKVEQELQDVPMSVSVVTGEELKRTGSRTVGEFLQDVPGVQIVDSGGQGLKRISIRGESPKRVLILVDGQKIVENKAMDGSALLIDPSRIERVEIIKGPASVLYGSEAIGGVVNIITKKGGTRPVEAEVSAFLNSASRGVGESASLFGNLDGFKYRISAAHEDQRAVSTPVGRARDTGFHQTDAAAFLSYDFEKLTVGGGFDFFNSAVNSGSMEEGYDDFFVHIPTWERRKGYVFAEAKEIFSFLPRLRVDAFIQRTEKDMHNHVETDPTVTFMPLVIDNYAHNYNDQLGLSVQADWLLGESNYLITGYDYSRDKLKATTLGEGSTSRERLASMGIPPMGIAAMLRALPYNSIAWHRGSMDTHALYAQLESALPWDFSLNLGVRQTWVRSKMTRAEGWRTTIRGTLPADAGQVGSNSDSRPVFNAGLTWSGIPDLTLRLTFSQGFRVASLQDRFVPSSMGGGTLLPNPDLKPEKSNTYEFGARWNPGNFSFDGVVYFSDAKDYISTIVIDARNDISMYRNAASAKTYGAELALAYDFACGLTPYASASWMRRKTNYGYYDANRQASGTWDTGDPTFTGRAGLRFEKLFSDDFNFFADVYSRFSSTSRLLTYDTEKVMTNPKTWPEVKKYGGWATFNLGFGFDVGSKRQYTVSAELLNIFNKRYQFDDSLYQPGRHATIRLSMRF